MYRLVITPLKNETYGLTSSCSNEFFLSSAEDVCKILDAFKSKHFFYSLTQTSIISSDDVIKEVLSSSDYE